MPTKVAKFLATSLTLAIFGIQAQAEAPLSAIDWLSQSLVTPAAQGLTPRNEPPIGGAGAAVPEAVTTSVLGNASLKTCGGRALR